MIWRCQHGSFTIGYCLICHPQGQYHTTSHGPNHAPLSSKVCPHGGLRRQCETCDLLREVIALVRKMEADCTDSGNWHAGIADLITQLTALQEAREDRS